MKFLYALRQTRTPRQAPRKRAQTDRVQRRQSLWKRPARHHGAGHL